MFTYSQFEELTEDHSPSYLCDYEMSNQLIT